MKCGMKWTAITILFFGLAAPLRAQEVTVVGSKEEAVSLFVADNRWSQKERGQQHDVRQVGVRGKLLCRTV